MHNRNLLDNWYFGPGVINQRGKTEYSAAGYTVDRWRLVALEGVSTLGSVSVNEGWLALEAGGTAQNTFFRQMLEKSLAQELNGRTVTLSVLVEKASGAWYMGQYGRIGTRKLTVGLNKETFVWDGSISTQAVQLYSLEMAGEVKVKAAKLELGDMQTLAHQDSNGNWLLHDPAPNPQQELANCQRYQLAVGGTLRYRTCQLVTNTIDFMIPTPVTLRAKPTVSVESYHLYSFTGMVEQSGFTFAVNSSGSNGILIRATKNGHGLSDAVLAFSSGTIIDANL